MFTMLLNKVPNLSCVCYYVILNLNLFKGGGGKLMRGTNTKLAAIIVKEFML